VAPLRRLHFSPEKHYFSASGTNFCYRLSKPQGLVQLEGLGNLKKIILLPRQELTPSHAGYSQSHGGYIITDGRIHDIFTFTVINGASATYTPAANQVSGIHCQDIPSHCSRLTVCILLMSHPEAPHILQTMTLTQHYTDDSSSNEA
jgi:hypothetical protein